MQDTNIVLYCKSMLAIQLSLNPLLPYSPPTFELVAFPHDEAEQVFIET